MNLPGWEKFRSYIWIITVPTMELPSLIFYTSHNAIILNDPNHTLLHIGSLILYIKAKHQLVPTLLIRKTVGPLRFMCSSNIDSCLVKTQWSKLCAHHRGLCGSGGIAPFNLNGGIRWKWVVSSTLQPLYPSEEPPIPTEYRDGQTPEPVSELQRE